MSANGTTVEDAEMTECDGEKVVTMMDVLQEQQEFEDDANAVLGASDDKNCTYNKGYIKRQAVYACLTCCSDAKLDPSKRAGVCLACSLTCHENHELVELYTKRNFCCDCGNPKFNHPCQYTPNKTKLNDDNIYNQNFSGLYCICHRPYPDADGDEEEMIQCIVCEDWLHASHLEATVPSSELYAEMICKACMEKNEFLHDYGQYAVNCDVDVVNISDMSSNHCNEETKQENEVDGKEELNESEKNYGPTESVNTNHDISPVEEVNTTPDDEKIYTENAQSDVSPTEDANTNQYDEKINTENAQSDVSPTEDANTNHDDEKMDAKKVQNDISPIEGVKTNPDVAEFKSEEQEQAQPNNPDTDSNLTDNNKDEEVSIKADNENSANNTQVKNAEENLRSDEISHYKTDENVTTGFSPADQENDAVNKALVESFDPKEESTINDHKGNETTHVTRDTNIEQNVVENATDNTQETNGCDKDDETTKDLNIEQNKVQNATDVPQGLTGCDSTGELQTKIQEACKHDIQENNDDPTDSTLTSAANNIKEKDGESEHVSGNNTMEDEEVKENKRKLPTGVTTEIVCIKKPKLSESTCVRPQGEKKVFKGATFWPSYFRQKLCTCTECITMYKDLSVLFLIDPEDTVTAYETLGKEIANGTASTQYEKGLEALSSLGRIQQINALTEYNKMRDKLLDFLKSFKDRKEIVKEEDIKAFFADMKPKREPDGVYFCR